MLPHDMVAAMSADDERDQEWLDADLGAEEMHGLIHYPPAVGVARMEKRLRLLRGRLATLHPNAVGTESEVALIRDIKASELRLAEFRTQLEGLN